MAHCGTQFAVADLNDHAILEWLLSLERGDWSRFTLAEQTAFAFALKQARDPCSITDEDLHNMLHQFSTNAIAIIAYICHSNAKTCLADALQLSPSGT
jgi:hypothetical protein